MPEAVPFPDGRYRFIPGPFQYSGGVCAERGFAIERVRFRRWLPMNEGFAAIRAHLEGIGQPLTAFCACELRSPAPFTEAGFVAFNREYIQPLEQWNIVRAGVNPVARSNVCPESAPPSAPCFYAFSYTVPAAASAAPSFVVSGSAEAREGAGSYRERTVRLGDRSPEAMREKAAVVLDEMERRMGVLGFGWGDVTGIHAYTVFDIHPLLKAEFAARGALSGGVGWHFARPPLIDLDVELDVRGVAHERML